MNPTISLTLRIADALAESGMSYLITGSFASNYYGIPRSTKDVDFVVQLSGALGPDFGQRLGGEFISSPGATATAHRG